MLPNDKDIEGIVLGTIISNRHGFNEVRDIINKDCFYDDFHRNLYLLYIEIESKGIEPDMVLLSSEYKRKYNELKALEISSLCEITESNHIFNHVCRLNDLSVRRTLIKLGHYLQNRGQSEQEDISDITCYADDCLKNLFTKSENSVYTISDAIKGVYNIITRNKSNSNVLTGSPTGFYEFDKKSGGLQKSDLVIIAGETSQGKTSFALSILNNTVKFGSKIAVYSLEMRKEQLAARLMAMESGIPANNLLYAPIDDYSFEQLDKTINALSNSTIYFDDRSTSNIDTIINSIRSMVLKYGIDGTIIDYLQILNVNMKGANKEQQMADVARRLKNLAKELDIWIIAISQLNRDQNNPVPNLNRLRDSGQIGEAADTIIFVYRPEYYNRSFPTPFDKYETKDMALIDVAKGRNIGVFKFLVEFRKQTTHFVETNNLIQKANHEPF